MGYTKFGEDLRILRIQNHEVMGDLAKVLQVSVPFLSAVETGKKNVPSNWLERLASHYALGDAEVEKLRQDIDLSKTQMKLDLRKADEYQRSAARMFARSFENMDQETAEKIIRLLERSN